MCFGGGSKPAAVEPPAPPPQLAKTPDVASVRATTKDANAQKFGTTVLTGGLGDTAPLSDKLGKKTLLGQ